MFRNMVIPGETIAEEEESEDTDDIDSVESYPKPSSTEYSGISIMFTIMHHHLV